jgi:hypothetical protein
MTAIETIIAAVFMIWLLLTVAYQFELKWIGRIDFHGFVPSCRFFSPNPVTTDHAVYFLSTIGRNIPDSTKAEWVPLIDTDSTQLRALWNPQLRLRKSTMLIVRQLMHNRELGPSVQLTTPYLRLLNLCQERCRKFDDAAYVKFIITRYKGFEDGRRFIVFESYVHPC